MSKLKRIILMMVSLIFCFSLGEAVLATASVPSVPSVGSNFIEENISSNFNILLKKKSRSKKKSYKPKIKKSKSYTKKSHKYSRSGLSAWKRIKKSFKFIIIIVVIIVIVGGIWLFIKSRR